MPGFISHTVMAHDAYKKIKNKHINLEYMLTYSLGGDLCKYAKCRYDSHHKYEEKFIDNMVSYIKENNLTDDSEILGVLYGHICHYVMDNTIHPLVRKVDSSCIRNKHNHALIEEYYDDYLVKERMHISKKEYLKQRILKAKVNKKISKMLDYVYLETYNTKNVSRYYKFNLFLYRNLRNIYIIFNDKILRRISGLTKFIKNNNIDLVNNNKKISNDSLNMLYDRCLDRFVSYYNKINI